MRWTRRRFLGGSVAAVCIGCSSDGDATPSSLPSGTDGSTGDSSVRSPLGGAATVASLRELRAATTPTYEPSARAWLVALSDDEATALAAEVDESLLPGLEHGVIALYEKCPHLGCRVPYCETSGWFECACHGSMFTRTGEHRSGPGPRGLDAFPVVVDGDEVSIDGRVVRGAPVGTVVVEQPPAGPHCVLTGDH